MATIKLNAVGISAGLLWDLIDLKERAKDIEIILSPDLPDLEKFFQYTGLDKFFSGDPTFSIVRVKGQDEKELANYVK